MEVLAQVHEVNRAGPAYSRAAPASKRAESPVLPEERMKIALLGLLVFFAAGCSQITGQPMPVERRTPGASFCVERRPEDGRDIASLIAQDLRIRGYVASSGPAAELPGNCDYRVTYADHWYWDMRMYLIDLRIDIFDAKNAVLLGYGESYQDSLAAMGKRFPDIVRRALDQALPKVR